MTILEETGRQRGTTVLAKAAPAESRNRAPAASPYVSASAQAAVMPPSNDWRQSWGKAERWTADESRKAVAQASARMEVSGRPKPPVARVRKEDPLRKPEVYARAPVMTREEPAQPPARPSLWARLTGGSPAKPAAHSTAEITPGMASILAAESPAMDEDGRPVARHNGKGKMAAAVTPPAVSIPAGAPNAFTHTVPPAGALVRDTGVPSGMGNAWTMAGSHRPVPSEMGMVAAQPHNAFQHAGMSGAAARPPMPPMMPAMMGMPPMMPPQMMAMSYYPPQAYYPPPAPAAQPVPEEKASQLITVLRNSVMPSEREMAVDRLSRRSWQAEPEVVNALVTAAKTDPAPLVRASCVRALGTMKVNTVPVVQAVQALKTDTDVRVREAADQALGALMTP
jgi:hypothetical protein